MKNSELKEKIIEMVESNKIWINAFECIQPTDEFKIKLANTILDMMKDKRTLLPLYLNDSDNEVGEFQKLTPVLYLAINKS